MSFTAVKTEPEVSWPEPGHNTCPICMSRHHVPGNAYRPHTLDDDCWCTLDRLGRKMHHRPTCWLPRAYGI